MKHGYLWRGIAVATVLGIIHLPGSSMVRADGQGRERKNVRGDGNSDESRKLLPTTHADHLDIAAAEAGGKVRGGGQIPRGAGAESVSDTQHNIEKGRHLKKKDKKKQLFVPPGEREDEDEKPADNSLFVGIKKAKSDKSDKSDTDENGDGKLKKAKGEKVEDSYIVVFDDKTLDADVERKAKDYTKKAGGKMKGKKSLQLIHGFAVEMTEAEAVAMSQRSDVKVRRFFGGIVLHFDATLFMYTYISFFPSGNPCVVIILAYYATNESITDLHSSHSFASFCFYPYDVFFWISTI